MTRGPGRRSSPPRPAGRRGSSPGPTRGAWRPRRRLSQQGPGRRHTHAGTHRRTRAAPHAGAHTPRTRSREGRGVGSRALGRGVGRGHTAAASDGTDAPPDPPSTSPRTDDPTGTLPYATDTLTFYCRGDTPGLSPIHTRVNGASVAYRFYTLTPLVSRRDPTEAFLFGSGVSSTVGSLDLVLALILSLNRVIGREINCSH